MSIPRLYENEIEQRELIIKTKIPMSTYKEYTRKNIAEMRPYKKGDQLIGVSISDADKKNGSPKAGDMIARNPKNHNDKWLVAKKYFKDNFQPRTK